MPHLGAATLGTEAVLGLTLGLGAAVFIAAAESAGDMLAVQMGLSGANVLDPISSTQMPVIGQFLGLFVTALLLASGGHLALLEVLHRSLQAFPPGGPVNLEGGVTATVALLGSQFVLGLRFAAPVVAAMMIGNAVLGVTAKTVPQLNVLMLAFPLQIGIGLVTLGLSLSLIAAFFGDWPEQYAEPHLQSARAIRPDGRRGLMASESYQDRTEAPTPKRRKDARDKGQIPRSQELTTALLLLAGGAGRVPGSRCPRPGHGRRLRAGRHGRQRRQLGGGWNGGLAPPGGVAEPRVPWLPFSWPWPGRPWRWEEFRPAGFCPWNPSSRSGPG